MKRQTTGLTSPRSIHLLPLLCIGLFACGAPMPEDMDNPVSSADIEAGTPANAYTPSCLIDIYDAQDNLVALCSGAVIAPQVVLTAGHCTYGFPRFHVTCPFLNNAQSWGTGSPNPDYHNQPGGILPNSDDVGLVFLQTRIPMSQYPVLRTTLAPSNTQAINVGRVLDGVVSRTTLFQSSIIHLENAAAINFPHDYYCEEKIQPGDSGGPTYQYGSKPLEIVGVNSGASTSFEILARVDLVSSWIKSEIAQHGGASLPGNQAGGIIGLAPGTTVKP